MQQLSALSAEQGAVAAWLSSWQCTMTQFRVATTQLFHNTTLLLVSVLLQSTTVTCQVQQAGIFYRSTRVCCEYLPSTTIGVAQAAYSKLLQHC
jgi:hypothetical protein